MTLHHGDCLAVLPTLEAESIDAIVTDPPYGLGFMGKAWDHAAGPADMPMRRRPEIDAVNAGQSRQGGRQRAGLDYQRRQARDAREYQAWCESWAAECYRVAKPGAHLLAFGGTRTYHRLASAIEDAGWEIRDVLLWVYASGFPKSHNLTGERRGWGTALKPAYEPIVMARKPLRGTVAANVTEYGTGALNIDGTRMPIADADREDVEARNAHWKRRNFGDATFARGLEERGDVSLAKGRWPANVILTDPVFDGDTPGVVGGGMASAGAAWEDRERGEGPGILAGQAQRGRIAIDATTYSRFFLIPKAARSDREPVLASLPTRLGKIGNHGNLSAGDDTSARLGSNHPRANVHPTVKPTELMRHLVRLVTPPGGIVLDPFLGSGTTALACEAEGFEWVGIEREAEYVAIAEARLNGTQRGLGLEAVS